jgi:hypothetical protein
MSQLTVPVDVTHIASLADLPEFLAAERAIAFMSVDWSGPERKGRERFLGLARRWQDASLPGIQFFLVNEDDDALRRRFPQQIRCACVPLGAGSLHWFAKGQVLRSEMQIGDCTVSQLIAWTAELWTADLRSTEFDTHDGTADMQRGSASRGGARP